MRYAQSKIFKVKLIKGNERPNITKKILLAMITQFQLPERLFVQPVSCQCAKSLYSLFCVIFRKKSFSQRHNFFIYLSLKKKDKESSQNFLQVTKLSPLFYFWQTFFLSPTYFLLLFSPNMLLANFSGRNSFFSFSNLYLT